MFSKRVREVELSGIRKYFEMADDSTINLGIGQPDFQPPEGSIDAYYEAMQDGYNGYGSTYGIEKLRVEIAEEYSKYEPRLTKDNVLIHVGATQAFKIITESLVDDHVEILCPNPGFVLFEPQVKLAGGIPISYPVKQENDFVPKVEDLEERRTSKTKAIIVNSPSNPCGGVFPKSAIENIVEWARENDILILSDEVYEKLTYEKEHESFLGKADNVIMVNSFSKRFAMTGWRVGFVITKNDWIEELGKINYYNIANPPHPTQHAVLQALKNEEEFVKDMRETFRKRRDVIVERLNDIPGFECLEPKGAFYAFPSFDYDLTGKQLTEKIMENGALVTPGSAFGSAGEGHLRLSYANSIENINKAMDIIEKTVARLD
ncbi:MAG: aminotransferase class I/II-fold pyridoxal phosphate-dependent enzyme [Candidatus Thermoplasmatota archaeon]